MNERRTLKAVKKWYDGRPLTQKEYVAVARWHRKTLGRIGQSGFEAMDRLKQFGQALAVAVMGGGNREG